MQNQQRRAEDALSTARQCFATRFAGASHMYVAGSIMRGDGNNLSDIDLVVVYPKLARAWRESFVLDGFPVEAFVHDEETLAHYFEKDVESGTPIIVDMVASGVIVAAVPALAEALQRRAQSILDAGPKQVTGERHDTMRYFLSDLADDLRDERPSNEIAAIAAQLYPRLIDLMLLGRNRWTGKGKWGPRLLRRFDANLAEAAANAFVDAVKGNTAALLSLTDLELDRHGGRYFDGYRLEAPLDARSVLA